MPPNIGGANEGECKMKGCLFAVILLLAIGVVVGLALIGFGVDLSAFSELLTRGMDPEVPQTLSTWEEVERFKAALVNPAAFEAAAKEQHPVRFKDGVYPPIVAQLVPVPEQGEGAVRIVITVPEDVPTPTVETANSEFSLIHANEIKSRPHFNQFVKWVGRELGVGDPQSFVMSQILSSKYFAGKKRITDYRMSIAVNLDPTTGKPFVGPDGKPSLYVFPPKWYREPAPPPAPEKITIKPKAFASTEKALAYLSSNGIEVEDWVAGLNNLYEVLEVSPEEPLPEFVVYQWRDSDGKVSVAFKKRYKESKPINTDFEALKVAQQWGIEPERAYGFLRSNNGVLHRPEKGGKWKRSVIIRYDTLTPEGAIEVERVITAVRDTVQEYANLVSLRVNTLRQKHGIDLSSIEMFTLIGEGLQKHPGKITEDDFPIIYYIEEGETGKKVRFEPGTDRATIRSLTELIYFADKTDHFDPQEFFDRLVWWAKNELKIEIADHKAYPFKEKSFQVIFDRTPELGPKIRFTLLEQPAATPPETTDSNGNTDTSSEERVLIGKPKSVTVSANDLLQKAEYQQYLRNPHMQKLAAAQQEFLAANPGAKGYEVVITTTEYLLPQSGRTETAVDFEFVAKTAETETVEQPPSKAKRRFARGYR